MALVLEAQKMTGVLIEGFLFLINEFANLSGNPLVSLPDQNVEKV